MEQDFSSRLKGAVLGLAVADAMGVPYEFRKREDLAKEDLSTVRGYGTHQQPPGTWSDDTSLTLCLIDSLLQGLDYRDIAERFVRWLRDGYRTPHGKAFDVGLTTKSAIENFEAGHEATVSGEIDEHSNGNGSLMRISPLAFFLRDCPIDVRRTTAFKVSAITHGHSRSKVACWLFIEIMIGIIRGESKSEAVDLAWHMVTNWLNRQESSEEKTFARCKSSIRELPVERIRSTGYVIDSLEAALWSFLRGNTVQECVVLAIGLGDDTDTVASIAGALAGLTYGLDGIPEAWLDSLVKAKEIDELCNQFLGVLSLGFEGNGADA